MTASRRGPPLWRGATAGTTDGRCSVIVRLLATRVSHAPHTMFENSPTRSWTSSGPGSGSDGSRPANASKRLRASVSGIVHATEPLSVPCSNRTVATSHDGTCAACAANARSSPGSATAKKLFSATLRTASNIADAVSGSLSFGKLIVGEFVEDISQYLRAERFLEIATDVELFGLFAPYRRAVRRNDYAVQVAPAIVERDLAEHLGAVHHRHVDVGEEQMDLVLFQQLQGLGPVCGLENVIDWDICELDDPLDHCPHHRRVVDDQNAHD